MSPSRLAVAGLLALPTTVAVCPPVAARDERVRDQAGQAELRWQLAQPFSVVGFAGVGRVAASLSDVDLDHLLRSFGAGLRSLLSPDNRLNIAIDDAVGKGSDAVYFFTGEAL